MAVLERVPVGRIAAEAREIRVGPALLTLVAGVLFALGWVAARLCMAVWAVLAWTVAAVRVGWREGMSRREAVPDGPG